MINDESISFGSILENDNLNIEYSQRRKGFIEKTIGKNDDIEKKYQLLREYKTKKKIFRPKEIDELLEDKVWCMFYKMGLLKISSRNFQIKIRSHENVHKNKQLDIFAVDEDIAFVVECKTTESIGIKDLSKDIAEFVLYRDKIHSTLRKILDLKELKFVDVFATENIIWKENDVVDALEHKIQRWDEYDILAIQEILKVAGEGAKYQIYNKIFYNQKIKNFEITIPAIKSKMGGIPYYIFSINPHDLLKISYVHRRSDKSDFIEIANSYQRMLKPSRIREIERYIEEGGFFPGSIIINFHKKISREDTIGNSNLRKQIKRNSEPVCITLPPYYGSAWVIDGQHRLYGYANLNKKFSDCIPVVAFEDIDSINKNIRSYSLESKLFVEINQNQKQIEANLLWDLYEDLYSENDDDREKQLNVISRIAKKLNSIPNSPFYGHISIPKEENPGNISLTAICTSIAQQKLISKDEDLLFNNSYEETILFATERIKSFFSIFKDNLMDEWNMGDSHYLRTNASMFVLMGILRDLVQDNLIKKELENINQFTSKVDNYLKPLILFFRNLDKNKISEYRGAGGAGQKSRQVRYELTKVMCDSNTKFRSRWFELYRNSILKQNKDFEKGDFEKVVNSDESEHLEFKGSLSINLDNYLKGDGSIKKESWVIDSGVIRAIGAFLNSKGGQILIGILEVDKYKDVKAEKLAEFVMKTNKIFIGIDLEYDDSNWDGFYLKLIDLIKTRIGPEIIDSGLIQIKKYTYENLDFCLIDVNQSSNKQYVNNKNFYIRRGNKTEELTGNDIEKYWRSKSL